IHSCRSLQRECGSMVEASEGQQQPAHGKQSSSYRHEEGWLRLPPDLDVGEVSDVATDEMDNVYLFSRGPNPIIVVNSEGEYQRSWGHGLFTQPHGLEFTADGHIWCTDSGDHTVRKF